MGAQNNGPRVKEFPGGQAESYIVMKMGVRSCRFL